jgi:maltose-binding protein MalE
MPVLLTGCDIEPLVGLLNRSQQTTPGYADRGRDNAHAKKTPTTPPPEVSGPMVITICGFHLIWIQLGGSQSASLFQTQLDVFASQNAEVDIIVRVKAQSGPGSLMESLSAATVAATGAVPSLVALPRTDLETAALKGLIYPIDDLSGLMEDPDWYPYARQLAVISDSTFGLPFGGESLLLVYRPERVGIEPDDWYSMLSLGRPIIIPAADPHGLDHTGALSIGGWSRAKRAAPPGAPGKYAHRGPRSL